MKDSCVWWISVSSLQSHRARPWQVGGGSDIPAPCRARLGPRRTGCRARSLTAVLRFWGPLGDPSVQHPDEYFLVYGTLHLFSGDFNHQHTLTAFYPAFHYYLLGMLYFLYFAALKIGGLAWSMDQWVAYHIFWGSDELVRIGRWTTMFFALGTVVWAGCVARRIWGEAAGWLAAFPCKFS